MVADLQVTPESLDHFARKGQSEAQRAGAGGIEEVASSLQRFVREPGTPVPDRDPRLVTNGLHRDVHGLAATEVAGIVK